MRQKHAFVLGLLTITIAVAAFSATASGKAIAQPTGSAAAACKDTECYAIGQVQCLDCPSRNTYFCNPTALGIFIECSESETVCAPPDGVCQDVQAMTGECQ